MHVLGLSNLTDYSKNYQIKDEKMSLCCPGASAALLRAVHPPRPAPLPLPLASPSPRLSFSSLQNFTLPRAKRKPSFAPLPQQDDELALDENFRDSINQLSTDAVKTMLSDNMKRMDELREKLLDLELYFQKEKEEDALRFILVVSSMLDHRILPEAKQLRGSYLKAFQKICSFVEDSGWHLKGDEEVGMVDDELIPPTVASEYR